jgi:hypothetical protein
VIFGGTQLAAQAAVVYLDAGVAVGQNFHVHADDGLGDMTSHIEAVAAKADTELVLILCVKAAMALGAGGIWGGQRPAREREAPDGLRR